MKKVFFIAGLSALSLLMRAQADVGKDSVSHVKLEEIVVSAVRAGKNTPMAHSNISQANIRQNNIARNVPVILQSTPSLVSFTEDGLGIGNTSLRIRGTDATRINVTLNGMPLNNPESQEVYWVNLPDLSSSLQSIQVQRGIGTSTNGSAAFGASISMKTTGARSQAYGEASTAVGSYGTFSSTLAAGSGILKNGLSLDARYSRNSGDGYVRNGKIDHSNLYVALSHYGESQMARLSYINGDQKTGITWEGISPEDMEKHGRRYNPAGKYKDDAGNTHFYDNETDNYKSHIWQLLYTREMSDNISLNANLNYNNGFGYYENYRYNRKYSDFGLQPQTIGDSTYSRTDFIRQKLMRNDFYVANLSVNYTKERVNFTTGGMYSYFDGDHYGRIPWVKHNQNIQEDFEWYRNRSKKGETSLFAKMEYQLNDWLSLFGDVQYRHINYKLNGSDDDMQQLDGNLTYDFFNPKAGVFYDINPENSLYASVAFGSREPLRSDLKDGIKGGMKNPIKPEHMIDYEAGYRHNSSNGLKLGLNFYYMDYDNQMVQTGKLSETGYKLMENVKKSHRAGIEAEVSVPFANNKLQFDGNATISQNQIKDYTAYFDVYNNWNDYKWQGQRSEHFGKTRISYSPDFTGMASLTYLPVSELYFNLLSKYVGKQYLDNTSDDAKSLDAYFATNFSAGYTFRKTTFGTIALQFMVNNLFNKEYIANGWAATDYVEDGSFTDWIGYYPQATRNYLLKVTVAF